MKEIEAVEPNGLVVVSTFAGCGGSCLGYRMAGFRVAWANEFVPEAVETYRANHPGSVVDERDVREVQPEEILRVTGLAVGELDLLDGSPPCDSFSLDGKRDSAWGKSKEYFGQEQRTDDLFFEFVRLVRGLQPRVFVAENVQGLVAGRARGYFKEIIRALKACEYRVGARVLDASWLDVPQARNRLFIVGVRDDLGLEPVFPSPLPWRRVIADACPRLRRICIGRKINNKVGRFAVPGVKTRRANEPCVTIQADGLGSCARHQHFAEEHDGSRRALEIAELRRLCGFSDDFILSGSYNAQWERLGLSVPPLMARAVGTALLPVLRGAESPGIEQAQEAKPRVRKPPSKEVGAVAPNGLVPPYRVPSMKEVSAIEPNGLVVVSTFSGCGGSCLGYRMAGFRVAWANEFTEESARIYRLNSPETVVDTRDVRLIQPEEILKATGLARGEIDVLDGSPPCDSFSLAGKRDSAWGKTKDYSGGKRQRTDDLFFEFIRLLDGLRPKAFVAENVKGLVIGRAKGYFKEILRAMKACGYRVKARVLDAQWLGVPQRRSRVVFVGLRDDLGIEPTHPEPMKHRYSLGDACPWITLAKYDSSGAYRRKRFDSDQVVPAILQTSPHHYKVLRERPEEVNFEGKAIHGEWEKLKPGQSLDKYLNLVRSHPDQPCPTVTAIGGNSTGVASVVHPTEPRKFTIPELKRICSFPDDFEMTGSFSDQWRALGMSVPPLMMKAVALNLREQLS